MDKDNPVLGAKGVTLQELSNSSLNSKAGVEIQPYMASNANIVTTQNNDFDKTSSTTSSWEIIVIVVALLLALKLVWTFRKNFSVVISRKKQ
jgi:CHASE2 domain-containing sensor protein